MEKLYIILHTIYAVIIEIIFSGLTPSADEVGLFNFAHHICS
jgi:hypothetical protein